MVSCGSGFDVVMADSMDLVAPDCERVRREFFSDEELDELFVRLGFVEVFKGLAPSPFE